VCSNAHVYAFWTTEATCAIIFVWLVSCPIPLNLQSSSTGRSRYPHIISESRMTTGVRLHYPATTTIGAWGFARRMTWHPGGIAHPPPTPLRSASNSRNAPQRQPGESRQSCTCSKAFSGGRVEVWRGDGRGRSVSTPRSSNRTGGFPASGSRTRTQTTRSVTSSIPSHPSRRF
jgi:hypothetical protein